MYGHAYNKYNKVFYYNRTTIKLNDALFPFSRPEQEIHYFHVVHPNFQPEIKHKLLPEIKHKLLPISSNPIPI
jgi:hypothetical protein